MSNMVKLQVYEHTPEEIVIDTFEGKSWDDFLVLVVDGLMDEDTIVNLRHTIEEYAQRHPEKHVILTPKGTDLSFYGFDPVTDD